jgi:hypothetical protein
MEGVDEGRGVREVSFRFPCSARNGPILPVHEVLELAVAKPRVEDLLDFEFFGAVDDDRWRRILDTTGDVARLEGLEERDVEHRVDLHGGGQLQTEGCLADPGRDGERAETLVVELVAGARRGDVASEEPHLVTDLELRGFFDLAVIVASLGCYGVGEDACELLVEAAERVD